METTTTTLPLTYGEKLVGITFNPSKMPDVDEIKRKAAEMIDLIHAMPFNELQFNQLLHDEAVTQIMTAQMWAVKFLTNHHQNFIPLTTLESGN